MGRIYEVHLSSRGEAYIVCEARSEAFCSWDGDYEDWAFTREEMQAEPKLQDALQRWDAGNDDDGHSLFLESERRYRELESEAVHRLEREGSIGDLIVWYQHFNEYGPTEAREAAQEVVRKRSKDQRLGPSPYSERPRPGMGGAFPLRAGADGAHAWLPPRSLRQRSRMANPNSLLRSTLLFRSSAS